MPVERTADGPNSEPNSAVSASVSVALRHEQVDGEPCEVEWCIGHCMPLSQVSVHDMLPAASPRLMQIDAGAAVNTVA